MAQFDILVFFYKQRKEGNLSYYTVKDLQNIFSQTHGAVIWRNINQLYSYGYLDLKVVKGWRRSFRLNSKYLKCKELEPLTTSL